MFWKGFEKRASEVTSAHDLEESFMSGSEKDPINPSESRVSVVNGGANIKEDLDPIDAANARNPENDSVGDRDDYK